MFIQRVIDVTDRIMQEATQDEPGHVGLDRHPSGQAQTVLLVDDDPASLNILFNFLSGNGLRVLPVNSGEVAVSVCHAYGRTIDVLVSGVEMHPVNGFQVADVVRSVHPQVLVVLMSGTVVCPATQHSAEEFLVKPFVQQDLLATISRRSRQVQ